MRRHVPFLGVFGALAQHGPHDFGNHVAGFVDDNRVSHSHVFAAYLVDIVQRGARYGRPGDRYGVEFGDGGQYPGSPNLYANLAQHRALFFGREFECDSPARCARGEAQCGLLFEGIDLHHNAVDVVIQAGAPFERLRAEIVHFGGRFAARGFRVYRKARVAQPAEKFMLRFYMQGVGACRGVQKCCQIAGRGDLWVFLAQAAGCRVARVGKRVASFGIGLFVKAGEAAFRHIDFAAYFDALVSVGLHAGQARFRKVHGHVANGSHVERHVFARGSIAARCSPHKRSVFIGERYAQAVYLQLARIGCAACPKRLFGAGEPFVEFFEVHGVVHGIHARHMLDRGELFANIAAHALRIGIGRHQIGEFRLDALQFDEQAVECRVSDLGRIEHIVAVGVVVEQVTKFRRSRCCRIVLAFEGLGAFGFRHCAILEQRCLLHVSPFRIELNGF